MLRYAFLAVLCASSIHIARLHEFGAGGVSGSTGLRSESPGKTPAREVATKTRTLQPGDSWSYNVTTSYPYSEYWNEGYRQWVRGDSTGIVLRRNRSLDFHGTLTVKVIQVAEGSGPTKLALLKNLKFSRKDKDVDQSWLVYFDQDSKTGSVTAYKKDQTTEERLEIGCLIPGSFGDGLTYTSVPLYGVRPRFNSSVNGTDVEENETWASVVSGSEKIRVKAGQFEAWKVSRISNAARDNSDNVWFAPDTGYFVKILESSPSGNVDYPKCVETIELASTTVSVPRT